MGEYTKPVCRGSWALGTACGRCERCEETRPNPPMINREELERLHEAAVAGPWRAEKIKGHDDFTQILHTKKDGKIGCVSADINDADGELTAHLRNAVPDILALITERAALTAENAALTEKVERLEGALKIADDAISEMFRYYDGGEMRGSYDGKPERNQLRKAGYVTRAALKGDEQ